LKTEIRHNPDLPFYVNILPTGHVIAYPRVSLIFFVYPIPQCHCYFPEIKLYRGGTVVAVFLGEEILCFTAYFQSFKANIITLKIAEPVRTVDRNGCLILHTKGDHKKSHDFVTTFESLVTYHCLNLKGQIFDLMGLTSCRQTKRSGARFSACLLN